MERFVTNVSSGGQEIPVSCGIFSFIGDRYLHHQLVMGDVAASFQRKISHKYLCQDGRIARTYPPSLLSLSRRCSACATCAF